MRSAPSRTAPAAGYSSNPPELRLGLDLSPARGELTRGAQRKESARAQRLGRVVTIGRVGSSFRDSVTGVPVRAGHGHSPDPENERGRSTAGSSDRKDARRTGAGSSRPNVDSGEEPADPSSRSGPPTSCR